MPRYRFSWSNIPAPLLQALSSGLNLEGDSVESLCKKYGTRPKESFIQDTWSILLEEWLKSDAASLDSLASALRKRGLGQTDIADNYAYIGTCKNTSGLRQEALCIFLTKGEQGDSANQQPERREESKKPEVNKIKEEDEDEGDWQRPKALDRNTLMDFALDAVASLYGVDKGRIYIDSDGDILAPSGSAAVFLSAIEGREFRVFSPMVQNVSFCDELLRTLNEINIKVRFGRLFFIENTIILEQILDAKQTSIFTLGYTVGVIGEIADFYDHKIQDKFGGTLFLRERAEDEINV